MFSRISDFLCTGLETTSLAIISAESAWLSKLALEISAEPLHPTHTAPKMPRGIFLAVSNGVCVVLLCFLFTLLADCIGMMFLGIGLVFITATVFAYRTINRRRDKTLQDLLDRGEKLSAEEIRKQGDKSPVFRYMI
jgi:hypothetical protein